MNDDILTEAKNIALGVRVAAMKRRVDPSPVVWPRDKIEELRGALSALAKEPPDAWPLLGARLGVLGVEFVEAKPE